MRNKLVIGLLLVVVVIFSGCTTTQSTDDGKLSVITTIGMIGDVAQNIAGEHATVVALMGPGVDPHLYKASAGDVQKLSQADIILYGGLHLEAKMTEVLEEMSGTVNTVAVTKNIPLDDLLSFGINEGKELHDPHVWFDVEKWISATEVITETLVEADPVNAQDYEKNKVAYIAKLKELHQSILNQVAEIPQDQRVLVTAHDAFSYFGEAYGFEVEGLQGISTAAEAGTGDVQELVDFIVDRKIKAIFVESSVPQRNIKAVQEAAAAKGWNVVIGGELFSDAMGDEGTFEGTYIGMVQHNVETIVGALK